MQRLLIKTITLGIAISCNPLSWANSYQLGQGYDSVSEEYKPTTCLIGEETFDPGDNSSTLNAGFTKISSLEIEKAFENQAVKNSDELIKKLEKIKKTANTNYRSTLKFSLRYQGPTKNLDVSNIGFTELLTPHSQSLLNENPEKFKKLCGDKLISAISYGSEFNVYIALNFETKFQKSEFDSLKNRSATGISNAADWLKEINERYKSGFSTSIHTSQIGGDKEKLSEILIKNNSNLGECSIEKDQCKRTLDSILEYISNDSFQESLRKNPQPIKYYTREYSNIILDAPPETSPPSTSIIYIREALERQHIEFHKQEVEINDLLQPRGVGETVQRWKNIQSDVKKTLDAISYNKSLTQKAIETCYFDIENCESHYANLEYELEPIKTPQAPTAVYYQETIRTGSENKLELECNTPDNTAATGIGARVYKGRVVGIKLAFRRIEADGSLTDSDYIMCGNGPIEAWVEAPEGELIVGIGGTIYKDNIHRLKIVHAPWNIEDKAIDRNYGVIYSRTGENLEKDIDLRNYPSDLISEKRTVITGVGLREFKDNLTAISLRLGAVE